jgi:CDP-glucose 4,6-dehydratase
MSAPREFDRFYEGRTVLITGQTGFMGSWLSAWLLELGAEVVGLARVRPALPESIYRRLRLEERSRLIEADVADGEAVARAFASRPPELVFHLAAQPLVARSCSEPPLTFQTNVMGAVNVLDTSLHARTVRSVVVVASPVDPHGDASWRGTDPYNASKVAAEAVALSYQNERVQREAGEERRLGVAVARPGVSIGGGDWAPDRLIPNVIRALSGEKEMSIRAGSVRPWQHVLEPLSGCLWLGARLWDAPAAHGRTYNFGLLEPERALPVGELVARFVREWTGAPTSGTIAVDPSGGDDRLLLDCADAQAELGWRPAWDEDEMLRAAAEWYRAAETGDADLAELTASQIARYARAAAERGVAWATLAPVS